MSLVNDDVDRIYNHFVKPNDGKIYLNRFYPLPMEKNDKKWKWEGKGFPRVVSLLEFELYVKQFNIKPDKLLTFNAGNDPELEYLDYKEVVNIEYNESTGENDLHNLNADIRNIDFVLLSQTLEHLYNPILALKNIYNLLSEGGYIYASVPVVNMQHSTPYHHYMGFTPVGLGCLFEEAGYKIIKIGQWGNQKYINYIFNLGVWADYKNLSKGIKSKIDLKMFLKMPETLFQDGIQNQFQHPVDAWILAQKI